MIVLNPYNVDALLYSAPIYSEIYILTHLDYWIETYIKLPINIIYLH